MISLQETVLDEWPPSGIIFYIFLLTVFLVDSHVEDCWLTPLSIKESLHLSKFTLVRNLPVSHQIF